MNITPQQIIQWACMLADFLSKDVCPLINVPPTAKGKYGKGLIKQTPDDRDLVRDYRARLVKAAPIPSSVDLRPKMPPVYDQGQLGSCTANAIAGAVQYLCLASNYKWQFTPSRLFLYYNERVIEGTPLEDSGAMLRDGLKALNSQGICPEAEGDGSNPDWLWPYSDDPIKFRLQPPGQCYKDAKMHGAIKYEAVPLDALAIKTCLAEGFPVIFGIQVYDSFESAQGGEIPMPDVATEQLLGGHALLCVGYDDATERFIFRNSWGEGWGNKGYGTIPYDYLTDPNLGSDYWCLELVGQVA